MNILGVSAYFHDSAAALICDGEIAAAAQEERFSRIKNDPSFPIQSIRYCLSTTGICLDDIDALVFYEKPFLKFERILETIYHTAPLSLGSFLKAMPSWIKGKLLLKKEIRKQLRAIEKYDEKKLKILFSEHHLSHAASAYFASGFTSSAIITIDGVGEWATCTIAEGKGNKIRILRQMNFPDSIGLFYSAITSFCGFKVNSDEYKLMGLAAYGNAKSEKYQTFNLVIRQQLLEIHENGSVSINQKNFAYRFGSRMFEAGKWTRLFGIPPRKLNEELSQDYCDLALAAQHTLEEIVNRLATHAKQLTSHTRLCLAGGVALNCVANGKLASGKNWDELFIQPASNDAGGALGAALAYFYIGLGNQVLESQTGPDKMKYSLLGPSYDDIEVTQAAKKFKFNYMKLDDHALIDRIANALTEGLVIGWHQGRLEFGPRALGNRSIIADPRNPDMQQTLNMKVKFREGFRPFAPIVLEEEAEKYFEGTVPSPYMLLAFPLKQDHRIKYPDGAEKWCIREKLKFQRSFVPSITHIDYTARLQTVNKRSNPRLYELLRSFFEKTGCPMLINTSFNTNNEPIVNSPYDALNCFQKTNLDLLVINNFIFKKN